MPATRSAVAHSRRYPRNDVSTGGPRTVTSSPTEPLWPLNSLGQMVRVPRPRALPRHPPEGEPDR